MQTHAEHMKGRHFVCAVKEDLITDWKRLLAFHSKSSRPHFVYGSDDRRFAAYAQKESTLWVVQLRRSDHPVLVARLAVSGQYLKGNAAKITSKKLSDLVKRFLKGQSFEATGRRGKTIIRKARQWQCVAVGARVRSRFFPFNDATTAVLSALFEWPDTLSGRRRRRCRAPKRWHAKYGSRLLAPRLLKLKDGVLNPFEELEQAIGPREVFLSYRHADREISGRLAEALHKRGVPIWLDRYALPVAEATKKVNSDERALTWLLDQGLRQSRLLVAVIGESYGGKSELSTDEKRRGKQVRSWTLHEWRKAKQRLLYIPPGESLTDEQERWLKKHPPSRDHVQGPVPAASRTIAELLG